MFGLPHLTSRQWATVVVIAFADFASAVCVSLQAPFYPLEAEHKGATASQYGLVFGIFELTVFVASPFFGKYITKLNPKFMFNTGLFVSGACSILFGVLDHVYSTDAFIGLSFAVRIVEALGSAAFLTASFAIVAAEFPDSVATTFASLETFCGLGLIVGPTLGGLLYEYGGFPTPFNVLGVLLFIAAVITYAILPNSESCDLIPEAGLLRALRIPSILLASFSVLSASIAIGFLSATLEPHLRQFSLSPVMMGLMFIIEGGIYAITAPFWGYMCDRKLRPRVVTFIGACFVTAGFMLVGPAPYIPLETSLPLAAAGLVTLGLGIGAELVSGFTAALQEANIHGFPNNLSTYGLVSGLWTSTFALGSFIGPSVAGILYDYMGFRHSSLFVVATNLILCIVTSLFLCFEKEPVPSIIGVPKQVSYSTMGPGTSGAAAEEEVCRSLKLDLMAPQWMSPGEEVR